VSRSTLLKRPPAHFSPSSSWPKSYKILESGIKDFCRERFRHAAILCVAVRNSGSVCSASAERRGEKAAWKADVCSWIVEERNISGIGVAEGERSLFNAMFHCLGRAECSGQVSDGGGWLAGRRSRRASGSERPTNADRSSLTP
jgi:hypothetical protein